MQHDPNPKMQEAVKGIWQAMVDNPKEAVDKHFAAVMEELLTECGSRQWRARQSAAAGLAELLTGRRFAEVEPYLEVGTTQYCYCSPRHPPLCRPSFLESNGIL
jgi:proteasome component ECM29